MVYSVTMDIAETHESRSTALCKACGLCCTGHLFIWVKLRPAELDPAEALGMHVYRSDPSQRGFSQPCPLWHRQCTIYSSSHYPHACRAYRCKLLKNVFAENISLPEALRVIEQAKDIINEVELLLPAGPSLNFREQLVARIEHPEKFADLESTAPKFQEKATALLEFYEKVFGVNDLLEKSPSSD